MFEEDDTTAIKPQDPEQWDVTKIAPSRRYIDPSHCTDERWFALTEVDRARVLLKAKRGREGWGTFEPLPEFMDRVPPFPMPDLVPQLVPLDAITMLHGQPRDLKSFIMLETALAIATGTPVFGMPQLKANRANVAYLTEEDSEARISHRLALLLRGRGLSKVPERFFLKVGQGDVLDPDNCSDDDPAGRLITECRRREIAFLVLDPLRSVTLGADQGPSELRPLALLLRRIVRECATAIGIVHHDVKAPIGRRDRTVDRRSLPQRASGGGIFSIADAPIHVDRLDLERVRLTPAAYKFRDDPDRIVVRLETDSPTRPTFLRLVGDRFNASEDDQQLRLRILEALKARPLPSGNEVARVVGASKPRVFTLLDQLKAEGTVVGTPVGRAVQWSLPSEGPAGSDAAAGLTTPQGPKTEGI